MTPDPRKLADAIDPRKAVSDPAMIRPDSSHRWCIPASDLIAASDFLRTLPNPTPDVADLVKRLRDIYTTFPADRAAADEAAAMLTLLQAQVAVARKMAVEECAAKLDAERRRIEAEHPASDTVGDWAIDILRYQADAIRSLSPTIDVDALVEKAAKASSHLICAVEMSDKAAYRFRHEHAKRIARAVLSALGVGRGE
jgi:hypothetical protein